MKKLFSKYSFTGILFIFILCYVVLIFIGQISKKDIELYQVKYLELDNTANYDALVLRDEVVLKTPKSGYIFYYTNSLNKVANDDLLYIIDEKGDLSQKIKENSNKKEKLTFTQKENIKNEIENLIVTQSYNDIKKLTYIHQIISENLINNIEQTEFLKFIDQNKEGLYLQKSNEIGIFMNSIDGYEGISVDSVSDNIYINKNTASEFLTNNSKVNANDIIGKIIKSESWSILLKINNNQYANLKNKKNIYVTFGKTKNKLLGDVNIIDKDGNYFLHIKFDNDMIRYAQDRYVSVSINSDIKQGYVIPKSSIKNINNETGVLVANNGIAKFLKVKVLAEEDSNYIIDLDTSLKNYDMIVKNASKVSAGERLYN